MFDKIRRVFGYNVAKEVILMCIRIGVVGLGYVGLPLAVAFGRKYETLGFDINGGRIDE